MRGARFILPVCLLLAASPARADCTFNSTGEVVPPGYVFYNSDYATMQYCGGNIWKAMGGGGARVLADLQDVAAPSPLDGQVLTYSSASGKWEAAGGDGAGDNLGDHTANQNIELGSHWLSGDGDDEGIRFDSAGGMTIGSPSSASGGVAIYGDAFFHYPHGGAGSTDFNIYTGATNLVELVSGEADGIAFSVDADYDAETQTLALLLDADGNVGIGTENPSDLLHVAGGRIRIDNDTNATNKGCIRFDGTGNKLQFSHDCTTFADMGSAAESDPQVGAVTNNQWCRGDGTAVQCDQAPTSAIPSGAVMAFDLASCPSGWTALSGAVGRVIVGVGTYAANADDDGSNASASYTLGATGGRRDHVLSVGEMPSHQHSTNIAAFNSAADTPITAPHAHNIGLSNANGTGVYPRQGTSSRAADGMTDGPNWTHYHVIDPPDTASSPQGGGGAHENRQPYIALLYCRKN